MSDGYKPCDPCGSTIPDEPNELDDLLAEVERLRAEVAAEVAAERLRAEVAAERAAVVAWLREQRAYGTDELLGQGFANVCGILSDAIESGEHRREEER